MSRPPVPVCVPARWGASRLPGKLLRDWHGRPVLHAVLEQAEAAGLGPVCVLAGDERIEAAARPWRWPVHRVEGELRNGSERIAEAIRRGLLGACDVVVNVQGDAVGARPALILAAIDALLEDAEAGLGTVAVAVPGEAGGRTTVAVSRGRALDFHRAPLEPGEGRRGRLLHVGIYAYRVPSLLAASLRAPGPKELERSLEQLRWLEAGEPVAVRVVEGGAASAHAIDSEADLQPG